MAILKNFFCCFSLRTGSVIIGSVGIGRTLVGIIVLSLMFAFIKSISVELMQKIIYHIEPEVLVMISSFEDDTGIIEGLVNLYMDLIFAIAMVILAIYVLFNGLLILGAVKKCRHLLIPYLCFETLMTIIACCSLKFSNYGGSESDFAGSIILNLMEIALSIYCILAVFSHFQEMRDGTDHQNRNYAMGEIGYQPAENTNFVAKKI